jgi:hypothetical protein
MAGLHDRSTARNATVRSSLDQVNQPGKWNDVAQAFLVAQKKRSKEAGVRVTASATTKAFELLSIASPIIAEGLSRELVPVATRAFNQWPIREDGRVRYTQKGKPRLPGYSKSLLLLQWQVRSETVFVGKIINRADYAAAINSGNTAKSLVFGPGRRAAGRAADWIAIEFKRKGET